MNDLLSAVHDSAPEALPDLAMLRLLQLASPALPIGAFAYSQGLEQATLLGWVKDEHTAAEWIAGLVTEVLPRLDVPVLAEAYLAWSAGDLARVQQLSAFLHACRESAELCAEDRHLGAALARVLHGLGVTRAEPWIDDPDATFVTLFSLAAVSFEIPLRSAALGLLFTVLENQVAAASRLIPIGHIAAQRVLSQVLARLPAAVSRGLELPISAAGFLAPGLAVASALHETTYSRLFRS
ncbi:MAG TPA: urease accessory UreF family protein [Polyangiaceae bacterium]|nr:urease accessory UreF family protein [Polyangiaceae bacterium]